MWLFHACYYANRAAVLTGPRQHAVRVQRHHGRGHASIRWHDVRRQQQFLLQCKAEVVPRQQHGHATSECAWRSSGGLRSS